MFTDMTAWGFRAPTRMWADPNEVDAQAINQLRNIAALPWVHGVAVMPDVHLGKGATVGSVIAMEQALSPAAVGVDIGCGMIAVPTSVRAGDLPDDLGPLRRKIEDAVPVGFSAHKDTVRFDRLTNVGGWDKFWASFDGLHADVQNRSGRALSQMGTLGGGNHFVEVCVEQDTPGGDEGRVWLMLHSGSRNIGKELAERHISVAKSLSHNAALPDRDLAVFLSGTPEMDAYRSDLYWAQEYATRNRAVMIALVKRAFESVTGQVSYGDTVNCHHNYVAEETYGGVEVLVTRKGAIRAGRGDMGIIPGSMGTGSFIVRGLGNEAAFNSASHGAGRKMSRSAAKRMFTVEDLAEQTAGVESRKDAGVIDEIPGSYKDIEDVLRRQDDLVEVVARIKQVLCVKG
ncbi:MAG: RNA-splicing ligase RtcB [Pseudonocardiales bacterium]|nr:MAG: RNA-splicing ligase RtcB [Pseudonocardiales bacterium]